MKDYSSRELILKVFSGERTDRVANFDLLRNRKAVEFFSGERLTENEQDDLRIVTSACQKVLDMTRTIRIPLSTPIKKEENGFVRLYQDWTSWIVDRPFEDYSSFREWVKLDVERLECWKPTEEYLESLRKDFERKQELLGDTVLMWNGGEGWFCEPYNEAGIENFSYLWYDDHSLFSDWIDLRFYQKRTIVELLADEQKFPIAFIGEDIAHKTGTIFSPAMLEDEFFPRLKVMVDLFHEKGIKIVFHSDGNLMQVLDQIIATEVDGLHPIEPTAEMSLAHVRELCPDRVVLIGNLDCSQLLPFGSKKEIEEEVKKIMDLAKSTGNIIFSSSSELHDEIPLENIVWMFECFEKYRRY
ncbi:MAG: uroporphyrinogen decarboxylase family protein [Atribacterales bacterium]